MISTIVFSILISFFINWCISLQILAQTEKEKRTRITATTMSLVVGIIIGLLTLL